MHTPYVVLVCCRTSRFEYIILFLIFSLVVSQDDCQFFMKKLEKLIGYN